MKNPPSTEESIPHILNREDLIVMSKTEAVKLQFMVFQCCIHKPESTGPQGLILSTNKKLAYRLTTI